MIYFSFLFSVNCFCPGVYLIYIPLMKKYSYSVVSCNSIAIIKVAREIKE